LWLFAKEAQRRRTNSVIAFSEVDAIEIHLEQLLLTLNALVWPDFANIVLFDICSDEGLDDFTLDA